jgi:hypothetical protein
MVTSVLELDTSGHVVVNSNDKSDVLYPPGQWLGAEVLWLGAYGSMRQFCRMGVASHPWYSWTLADAGLVLGLSNSNIYGRSISELLPLGAR